MAKTDNLVHYLSDIADAIREKEGSTDPISAQDFSEHIRAMATKSDVAALDFYYFADNAFNESGDPTFLFSLLLELLHLQNECPFAFPFSGCIKLTDSEITAVFPAHILQNVSGLPTNATQIAIPKYTYAKIDGSGVAISSTHLPITELLSVMLTEEQYLMFEDALQNQQITKEEFWNV